MALTDRLEILITANGNAAVREFSQVGNAADRELGRATNSADKLGGQLSSVGATMIGVGAVLVAGMGAAAQASEGQTLANTKLENTLANMPKLSGETADAFYEQAEALQKVTAAGDDEIVTAQAMLGTFNLTGEQIRGITPLVVDYARKFGTDLPGAAVQVGKALDGSIGALKRNGVSIDENIYKTDRYRAVNEALSDQVGGFAEAEGKTFSGQLEIMKNQLGEVAEGVGVGAVEAFSTLLGPVQSASGWFQNLDADGQKLVGTIGTFGGAGLIAVGGLSMVVGQAIKMRENIGTLVEGLRKVGPALAGNLPLLFGFGAALAVAGFAFYQFQQAQAAASARRADYVTALEDQTRATEESVAATTAAHFAQGILAKTFQNTTESVDWEAFSRGIRDNADELRAWESTSREFGGLDKLQSDLEAAAEGGSELARAILEASNGSAQVMKQTVDGLVDEAEAYNGAKAEAEKKAAITRGLTSDQVAEAESTREATEAQKAYADELRSAFDPLFAMQNALSKNTDAKTKASEAELGLYFATVAYNDALRRTGDESLETAAKRIELDAAERALTEAQQGVAKSALDVDVAASELNATFGGQPDALAKAGEALDRWVAQGLITKEQADAVKWKFFELSGQVGELDGSNAHVTATADTTDATTKLTALQQLLLDVNGPLTYFDVATGMTLTKLGPGYGVSGSRALGGPVTEGRTYLVGENGPELFRAPASGYVHSNGETRSMAAGGGSVRLAAPIVLELDGRVFARAVAELIYDDERALA